MDYMNYNNNDVTAEEILKEAGFLGPEFIIVLVNFFENLWIKKPVKKINKLQQEEFWSDLKNILKPLEINQLIRFNMLNLRY